MGDTNSTRDNILQAALREFGIEGYKNASTNRIYPAANTSKGAIFKIFRSKAELFYSVFVKTLDDMLKEMERVNLEGCTDAFDKIMAITLWKMDYAQKKPWETKVMFEAISDPPEKVREKIMGHVENLKKMSVKNFFSDIPMDRIRSEFSREDVMKYVEIAISGIQATYVNRPLSIEYMASIKEESINFIKAVLKGME